MDWAQNIRPRERQVLSKLVNDKTRIDFTWARRSLDGLPGCSGLNIAHEAVDRHARRVHGVTYWHCEGSASVASGAISHMATL